MRVVYRDFNGRAHVREFRSWADMCYWLKVWFPLIEARNELRQAFGPNPR